MSIYDDHLEAQRRIYGIGPLTPAARSLPAYEREVEQVTVARSEQGDMIAMTFLNASDKFVSTIKTVDAMPLTNRPGGVYLNTVIINRTGHECVISTRAGIHLPSRPVDHASARGMVIRHLYVFNSRDDVLSFARRTNAIPSSARSAVADTMLRQAQKILDEPNYVHSLQIVVDHRIEWSVIEAKKRIYDPNTDLVISLADTFDQDAPHPALDAQTISSAFNTFCAEQTTHFAQHLVKVCVADTTPRKLYYKYLGHVHCVQANPACTPMASYEEGENKDTVLNDFVEIYSSAASAILKCNGQYITQTYAQPREPVLIARVSLEEAMNKYGIFDSAHLAQSNGNPDLLDEQLHRRLVKDQEATILDLKRKLQEQTNFNSSQDHERKMAEAVAAERAHTAKVSEELRQLTIKTAQQDAEHKAKIAELEQKRLSQLESHQQTIKESEKKGWVEVLKVVGAGIVLVGTVVAGVMKIWPMIFGAAAYAVIGIGKALWSGLTWLGSTVSGIGQRLFC